VIDANVVAKWFMAEEHSDRAVLLLESDHALIAPDLLVPELGSIFREKILSGELAASNTRRCLDVTLERVVIVPSEDWFVDALSIATSTGASFYDALYVALALGLATELVTNDGRLIRKLGPDFSQTVRSLAGFPN
jgi:predicted nucleic acid-binding protein